MFSFICYRLMPGFAVYPMGWEGQLRHHRLMGNTCPLNEGIIGLWSSARHIISGDMMIIIALISQRAVTDRLYSNQLLLFLLFTADEAVTSMACHMGLTSTHEASTHTMLVQCWTSVVDDGPTLNKHWVDDSCLLGWNSMQTRNMYSMLN